MEKTKRCMFTKNGKNTPFEMFVIGMLGYTDNIEVECDANNHYIGSCYLNDEGIKELKNEQGLEIWRYPPKVIKTSTNCARVLTDYFKRIGAEFKVDCSCGEDKQIIYLYY